MATDDTATVNQGAVTTINVAANDTAAGGVLDLTSVTIAAGPSHGSVAVNADGTVNYDHDGTQTTADSFTYTIADTVGTRSNVATVTITVTPVNDAPVAVDDSAEVLAGGINAIDVAANDSDAQGGLDLTSISIVSGPSSGSLVVNADGTVTYTHNGSVSTADSFTYTIKDTAGVTSNVATVSVAVVEGFNEALYATPTVRSTTAPERQYQANDGIEVTTGNGWVGTEDETVPSAESWIRLSFDSTKTIHRVDLGDVAGPTAQLLAGSIEFSDGSSVAITSPLPDDGTPQAFFFSPKRTDWVQVRLTNAAGAFGLSEILAYSALDPGQTQKAADLFNDGNATGWTVVNADCDAGVASWNAAFAFWAGAGNQYQQTGNCRGITAQEGVEKGSYALLNSPSSTIAGMDLRLRMRSDDNPVDDPLLHPWVKGAMGVLFGYQNTDNYYRLDLSQLEGHRSLWKKKAGVFTELNTSPQSYTHGLWPASYSPQAWTNLRVVSHNGVIVVYVNGRKVLAVEDPEPAFNGQVALLCARNESCTFDNVILLDAPSEPILGLNVVDGTGHRSGEYYVSSSGTLDVSAMMTATTGVGGVQFVADEGPGETVLEDFVAPYAVQFNMLAAGTHTVRAYLLDELGTRRLTDSEAAAELPQVGISGIHIVALADSITSGVFDDIASDDISSDGRNTSGGYQPVLNNLLTGDNAGKPVTVLNEANPGETSAEGAVRIDASLQRTPGAEIYLMFYGANDSAASLAIPSGLGTVPNTVTPSTFKDYMQVIINKVRAAGKVVYPAKAPPYAPNTPGTTRDLLIQEYNLVVQELVDDAANGFLALGYTPPDFHAYFSANPSEMIDPLHPNGTGYRSMARLWCAALNGQPGLVCIP